MTKIMGLAEATLFLVLLFHHAAVLAEVTFQKVTKEPGDIKELSRSQVKGKTTCAVLCWKNMACTHYKAEERSSGVFLCILKGYNETVSSGDQKKDNNSVQNTWAVVSAKPRSCRDIWVKWYVEKGQSPAKGVYPIYPNAQKLAVLVLCAMDMGGWIVGQFSKPGKYGDKWNSTWESYQKGFMDVRSLSDISYVWAGLKVLYELTKEQPHTLRILGFPQSHKSRYEEYGFFQIDGPSSNYRAHVGEWNTQGGLDLLNCPTNEKMAMNGSMFTTWDKDNDNWAGGNRASIEGGGWWYNEYAAFTPTRVRPIYFVDCNKTDGYRRYFNLTTMVLMPRG